VRMIFSVCRKRDCTSDHLPAVSCFQRKKEQRDVYGVNVSKTRRSSSSTVWREGREEKEEEEEEEGEEAGKRNAKAKKIEAPERVGWTGIMAVLELHYQSSVPSAPRHRLALRALRSTPFHSIPPLFHPYTTLETLAVPYSPSPSLPPSLPLPLLAPGKTPVKHGRFPRYLAAQALSPLSWGA